MDAVNILAVDDEATICMAYRSVIEKQVAQGKAFVAFSGKEALELLEQRRMDVLITDIRMPEMDGIQLMKRAKAMDQDIETIVVSAYEDFTHAVEAMRLGAANFLTKPVSAQALAFAVERACAKKKIRRALAESEKRYRRLVESLNDGIIETDEDLTVQFVNHKACAILGLAEKALAGRDVNAVLFPASAGGARKADHFKKTDHAPFEIEYKREDGRTIWLRISATPRYDDNGAFLGCVAVISDVTELVRAHEQARLREMQLIKADKLASLGVLVSGVAHEINNPNNFISFNLPILREYLAELLPVTDAHARRHSGFEPSGMPYAEFRKEIMDLVDDMEHGSQRISAIVSDLTAYSQTRYDKGKSSRVDLRALLESARAFCRGKIKKMVRSFEMTIPESIGRIYTNAQALEQVFINLMINAAQAMDKEDSRIRLCVTPDADQADRIIIEVSDNGCGIEPEAMEKIFDPFYTTKPMDEGTGLGLYICHNLIQGIGGEIRVRSAPGVGTTVAVVLNLAEEEGA